MADENPTPPTAKIIDGTAIAARVRASVARRTAILKTEFDLTPTLAVVLVGDDPASQIYVGMKTKRAAEVGMKARDIDMSASAAQGQVIEVVEQLNADKDVHAILVQLPLPPQIKAEEVIDILDPAKDVDGLHIINTGLLTSGRVGVVPATPLGCLALIKSVTQDLEGLDAVVVGRSNLVGKPIAQLLLREHCSVTTVHSRTRNLDEICRRADILVAAVGRPEMVRGDWIKPGAIVIDVGINRLEPQGADEKGRLVGDVNFAEAAQVAGAITPVPKGVGPMTIACLLQNTLALACRNAGVPMPKDPEAA
ncbi:MAG: bifunctional methylenetetrahydrofolate dehydrogenase/methenyltetrahydrofolate cyclohydrolase FolD [Alphaproteobacteria bacterium]|jgi:methylenetetrahydrofolate dehydrogenase (NADP+) / methenyltetrahydrofolate cyclohydrolase|nr:bifunctional methylenetetrahydrofolate dehydrogenase/methenyltetrahydrofolate cyclohydrolase FolD [Alphaproteobacteria bacterium]MBT4710513.1 bifunctional methylenetetrahydrofolate dehydrogenase/methenyltetrahydrofolate cyclohydrolase FolD [Alphaproteobacteria bacterium]